MIEAKKVTFKDLFNATATSQIRVPDYQRGYSWTHKQVKEFFDDLTYYYDHQGDRGASLKYFLGPIVLMKGSRSDSYFYAVDGQQRMATFVIFLAVIRDAAVERFDLLGDSLAQKIQNETISSRGPGGNLRWAYRLGDLDKVFFRKFVQSFPRAVQLVPANSSNGLIKRAWNTLSNELDRYLDSRPEPLDSLNSLYQMLMEDIELVAIEVKGEREAMSVFERINVRGKPLSESDLIRHRLMSNCLKDERPRLRAEWDKMETLLGGQNAKIDAFLRHMWISRTGERASSKLYDDISLYLEHSGKSSVHFVEDTLNDCQIYTELLKPQSSSLHHKSRNVVRAVHTTLGVKQALPVFLSGYRKLGKTPEFSELVLAIEALVIRHIFFANHDPAELSACLYQCAQIIHEAPSRMQALRDAIISIHSICPSNAQVISGSQRQMQIKTRQALYILREIENSLGDGSFNAQATLEHIYPQKATKKEWKGQAERLKPYLWHIGNLTLLASAGNAKAGNRSFGYKKNKIYRDSSVKITNRIVNYNSWGRAPILRRAEELAKLANRKWNVTYS